MTRRTLPTDAFLTMSPAAVEAHLTSRRNLAFARTLRGVRPDDHRDLLSGLADTCYRLGVEYGTEVMTHPGTHQHRADLVIGGDYFDRDTVTEVVEVKVRIRYQRELDAAIAQVSGYAGDWLGSGGVMPRPYVVAWRIAPDLDRSHSYVRVMEAGEFVRDVLLPKQQAEPSAA